MSIAYSQQVADWGVNLDYARIPPDVVNAAQRAVFDTLGVIAASATHPVVSKLISVYGEHIDTKISSNLKLSLMDKVSMTLSKELSSDNMRARYPESAKITLHLIDGGTLSGFCGQTYGMPSGPLTENDLLDKFNRCTAYAGLSDTAKSREGQNLLILGQEIISNSVGI